MWNKARGDFFLGGGSIPKVDVHIITLILNKLACFKQCIRIVGTELHKEWAILLSMYNDSPPD